MMNVFAPAKEIRVAAGPAKAPPPKRVVYDWTDYCNAKCFFCGREAYEKALGNPGSFIPFEQIKKLAPALRTAEVFCISSGIGEPLLHPELKEILDWLYELNPSILLQTVTNGTALTASKASWFAGHLDWLSVSLNASNGEAHMRDMFPHLAKRGINAQKRWDLHIRHLTEFVASLPPADRKRIRFQMVTHRDNVKDVVEFVRLVKKMGGTYAGFPNISVHPETVDRSLFWIKDEYNDLIEEACEVGTQLGVQVNGIRFYTSVKPVVELDKICRDPVDVAYISRSSQMAPCCQWSEPGIAVDMYSENGFEQFWNNDILARLRRKRDSRSCKVCGMLRVFDETSFHFSPYLKKTLVEAGQLSDAVNADDYPDARLVKKCVDNRLDLPGLRRTLRNFGQSPDVLTQIEGKGLSILPQLERDCWQAFQAVDLPISANSILFGGPFLGIGWGPPSYEPEYKVSSRSLCVSQSASVFVRVTPGIETKLQFVFHPLRAPDFQSEMKLQVCGQSIKTVPTEVDQRIVRTAFVPAEVTKTYDGRLFIQLAFVRADGSAPTAEFSLTHLVIAEASVADGFEQQLADRDATIRHQSLKIVHLEGILAGREDELRSLYHSRSFKITSPLRKLANWIRR